MSLIDVTMPTSKCPDWVRAILAAVTDYSKAQPRVSDRMAILVAAHLRREESRRMGPRGRTAGGRRTGALLEAADATFPLHGGREATVVVNSPVVARADHDVTIRPVLARALAIPVHPEAYGRRPSVLEQLLGTPIFRPKGKHYLAARMGDGMLRMLYLLVGTAYQLQDETLLPTQEEYQTCIGEALTAFVSDKLRGVA